MKIHYLKSELILISSSIFKTFIKEMSEIRLITDNTLFFSSYEEIKTYKFSESREEVDMRKEHANVPGIFSQINIFTNTKTAIYKRSYRKLFEVIAQIGGFSNRIIFAAQVLLYIYSENILLYNCISTLISPKEIKENLGIIDD